MASIGKSPNPWPPFNTYNKDCSQGICSIYCPQWCYILFSPPPPPIGFSVDLDADDNNSGTKLSPLSISLVGILAAAFILLTYYTIVSKFCRRNRNENNNNNNNSNDRSRQATAGGLDEKVIKSIKVYKYNKRDGFVEGSDCSVCLGEFEENQSLRLLPKCNHAFHLPCIDVWLKSNSSCPLCRSNIAELPQQISNVSAHQHQLRTSGNNDAVLVVVQDFEQVGVVNNNNLAGDLNMNPKAPIIEESVALRRSVSLNIGGDRVLVADILRASEEDEDVLTQIENSNNNYTKAQLLPMKRSISTGRFGFTRYAKGSNSILPN
ncbi:hypothetical protein UlMin_004889 [Ulmus minor]